MPTLLTGTAAPYSLPEQEEVQARETSVALASFVHGDEQHLTLSLNDRQTGRQMEVAVHTTALQLLIQALAQMAEGHSLTLMPLDAELSTQQAAELMGVSRPYFVKLLEEGRIPFRRVGSQRRVRFQALRRYMEEYQQESARALEAMTAEAQQMGLYE